MRQPWHHGDMSAIHQPIIDAAESRVHTEGVNAILRHLDRFFPPTSGGDGAFSDAAANRHRLPAYNALVVRALELFVPKPAFFKHSLKKCKLLSSDS